MDTTLPSDAQAAIDAFQDGIIGRRLHPGCVMHPLSNCLRSAGHCQTAFAAVSK